MFAAETVTILLNSTATISLDIRMAIPTGFYGKLFPRSVILKKKLLPLMQVLLIRIIEVLLVLF